jgi:hypothetical protein
MTMSGGNLFFIWMLYLLAAGVLGVAVWKLSARLRVEAVRVGLVAALATGLLWPAVVDPAADATWRAPAFIVVLFGLGEGWEAAARALYPLLAACLLAVLVAVAGHGWYLRRRRPGQAAIPTAPSADDTA